MIYWLPQRPPISQRLQPKLCKWPHLSLQRFARTSVQHLRSFFKFQLKHRINYLQANRLLLRIALAQYRSTIEPLPDCLSKISFKSGWKNAFLVNGPDSGVEAWELDAQELTGDVVVLGPALRGKMSENVVFNEDKIVGGSQTLAGCGKTRVRLIMLSRFGDYVTKGRVLVASAAVCRSLSSPADTDGR